MTCKVPSWLNLLLLCQGVVLIPSGLQTPVPPLPSLYRRSWFIALTFWLPSPSFPKIQLWSGHSSAPSLSSHQQLSHAQAPYNGLVSVSSFTSCNPSLSTFPLEFSKCTFILSLRTHCYFHLQIPCLWLLSVINSY